MYTCQITIFLSVAFNGNFLNLKPWNWHFLQAISLYCGMCIICGSPRLYTVLAYVACSRLEKLSLGTLHIGKTNVISDKVSADEFVYQDSQRQTLISSKCSSIWKNNKATARVTTRTHDSMITSKTHQIWISAAGYLHLRMRARWDRH